MAITTEKRKAFFPSAAEIPSDVRVSTEPYEMRYLIDGQIRTWNGPAQDIYSPVCIEDGTGPKRYKLGRCALLTEKESLEALDAACRAYADGKTYREIAQELSLSLMAINLTVGSESSWRILL